MFMVVMFLFLWLFDKFSDFKIDMVIVTDTHNTLIQIVRGKKEENIPSTRS